MNIGESYNKFALDLYKKLSEENHENLFFSPYSLVTTLNLVFHGSSGNTENELRKILNYEDECTHKTVAEENEQLLAYYKKNSNLSEKVEFCLKIASKLYFPMNYQIKDEYQNLLEKYYKTTPEAIDFENKRESASKINEWVKQNTNGCIDNIINERSINDKTKVILINAIYFQDEWKKKFKEYNTKVCDFYLADKSIKKVPLMYNKTWFRSGEFEEMKCKVCLLPYENLSLSMIILLPDEDVSLNEFMSTLNVEQLNSMIAKLKGQHVELYLPRFKFEQTHQIKHVLKQMGLEEIFNEDNSKLSIDVENKNLFVTEVLHKTLIEVNEEKTKAAAVTCMSCCKTKSARYEEPLVIKCDRPFTFLIFDCFKKIILFLGKYEKPDDV